MSTTNNIRGNGTKGLEHLTVLSQREVAKLLGISAMRVSQLERAALKKLRRAYEREWAR